jgi:macrolide transport system ATP-binding/permease protein
MLILEAKNIKKHYSERVILEFDEFKVYSGDKIGIVGQNGSGKTTLMNILANEIESDEGFVRQFCNTAYIRQFSEERIEADAKSLRQFNLFQKSQQNEFSGGEKTRIKIANALSSDSLLLFADEPTANLDNKGVELLKQKLTGVETILIISHDRLLLDCLCNKILEIRDGKIKLYNGNYSFYKEQVKMENQNAEQNYEKYISDKIKLEGAIKDRQSKSKSIRKAPKRMGNSEARLHTRRANEKQEKIHNAANSLKTRLEKLEVKEKPKELPQIKLDFSMTNPPENRIVISVDNLSFSYGSQRIFSSVNLKVNNGLKIALWGENGTGKTTLLNLIGNNTNKKIYIVPKAKIGYFYQGFENLEDNRSILENVMKDSVQTQTVARTVLARLLISGEDVHKSVSILSGGERIKVSFAKLFVSDANVLLLDEPTNYLDMNSIEALEKMLQDYEGTVLFVSHDNLFVNAVADRLFVFENQTVNEFEGSLKEYNEAKERSRKEVNNETEKIILQMRIAETVAKLSRSDADKEALEAEYAQLILQMR